MLITFECGQCNSSLEVDASAIGTEVECPECGATITIPKKGPGPGTTIGGFRITDKLGAGGMGEVYLARQISMDRDVALKILPFQLGMREDMKDRFLNEVRLLARLDHTNIVTAFEAGEDSGFLYVAMALVGGDSLEKRLKGSKFLIEDEALEIGLSLAGALSYAWNEHNLLHRDIKPSNVLFDKHGTPKLVDFGLAKSLADGPALTMSEMMMGTPNYMSPEQAVDAARVDFRADMYSLGATIYHMVSGQMPFQSSSIMETLRKQAVEPLVDPRDFNPDISEYLINLLGILLAKDPADRHESWEALIGDIKRVKAGRQPKMTPLPDGGSVLMKRPKIKTPGEKPVAAVKKRKSSGLLTGGIAAGVVALVGLVILGVRMMSGGSSVKDTSASAPAASSTAISEGTIEAVRSVARKQETKTPSTTGEEPSVSDSVSARKDSPVEETSSDTQEADEALASRSEPVTAQEELETEPDVVAGAKRGNATSPADEPEQRIVSRASDEESGEGKDGSVTEPEDRSGEQYRKKMNKALEGVVMDLLKQDFRGAETAVDLAYTGNRSNPLGQELKEVKVRVAAVAGMDRVILDSFKEQVREEVPIDFKKGGTREFKIVSVKDGKVNVLRPLGGGGTAVVGFSVNDLSLKERFKRLGDEEKPEREIMRGLLAFEGKSYEAACGFFEKSDCPLGSALENRISEALAQRQAKVEKQETSREETAALKAYRLLVLTALPDLGDKAADPDAVASVTSRLECTRFEEDQAMRIKKSATAFKKQYGETDTASVFARVLAALQEPRVMVTSIDADLKKKVMEELKKANGGKSVNCVFGNGPDGVRLDLSDNAELTDISALEGLPIAHLDLAKCNKVSDLTPLRGMPLKTLNLAACISVADISPLKGMPLEKLVLLNSPQLSDLSPLKGMPLTDLTVASCHKVRDLSPLEGMKLTVLNIADTGVSDLGPLKGMPLVTLTMTRCESVEDFSPLMGMKTLIAVHANDREAIVLRKVKQAMGEKDYEKAIAEAEKVVDGFEDVPAFSEDVKAARDLLRDAKREEREQKKRKLPGQK